jgi:hypothetical protein
VTDDNTAPGTVLRWCERWDDYCERYSLATTATPQLVVSRDVVSSDHALAHRRGAVR